MLICCKVDVLAAVPGQFVPFAKHTDEPFTAIAEAFKVVPEAVAKPSQEVEVPFVKLRLVEKKFVEVASVNVALGAVSEAMVPLFANRLVDETTLLKKFVVVTEVNVAFVPVSVASEVAPSTVKVDVTVDEDVIKPPKR